MSSSLSPSTLSSSSSSPSEMENTAIFCVKGWDDNREHAWYAFDISDDQKHTVSIPPPSCLLKYGNNYFSPSIHGEEEPVMEFVNRTPIAFLPKDVFELDNSAILGTSLYRIGHSDQTWDMSNSVYRIDILGGSCSTKEWESVGLMPNPTLGGHALVLGQKLYCLGGIMEGEGEEESNQRRRKRENIEPWAMAYDPALKSWESLPDPPCRPICACQFLFSAAMDDVPSPYIVVGTPSELLYGLGTPSELDYGVANTKENSDDGILQIYRVDTKRWEEPQKFENILGLELWDLVGHPAAVDNKLYWFSIRGNYIDGYDLVTKAWLKGCVPGMHDHGGYFSDFGLDARYARPRLAHLGGGHKFCLFWVSVLQPSPLRGNVSCLHCMKFHVTASANSGPSFIGGVTPLEVSSLSCQSVLVSGQKNFLGSLIV